MDALTKRMMALSILQSSGWEIFVKITGKNQGMFIVQVGKITLK